MKPHPRADGFSLIELLVVVTIVGVFAGAAVLSLGIVGSDRVLQREALRFRSLVDLLAEEALMQSRDYGVRFTETGYRFYVYDHQRLVWLDPIGDAFLSEYRLPEGLVMALSLEDRAVVLEPGFDNERPAVPEPQVVILASGEVTPFEAAFYRNLNGGRFVLNARIDGSVEISERGFGAF
ncbi:MAG: type II secretion system minor pseudopilin GspH [Rhodospirillaceae bacterium]|nr:type II secretion system minor pseudopilin GspH [Rhodospirillaceae bacterium]